MLSTVAIVGRPNVGKSTLFNRIAQQRLSIVENEKGVTRDRLYTKAFWLGKEFRLIDTGGIEATDLPFIQQIKIQAEIAMDEADVIIFVVDITDGVVEDDTYIAQLLYRTKKPIIVVANHMDNIEKKENLFDFYQFGFDEVIGASAVHGIGIGDMLDAVVSRFPVKDEQPIDEDTMSFCFIGRPNVGKSSLVNALLGKNRVIVSDIAGTTRDAIDTDLIYYGKKYRVIDTAGMRRKGKISEKIEKYSILRALAAVERSNIVCVVLDASVGILEQDKKIAGIAHESGKGVILVVNKWDAVKKDNHTMQKFEAEIRETFKFLEYAPIIYVSALENKRMATLYETIERVYENQQRRVSTSVLNEILQEAFLLNPPAIQNNKRLKLYYATQISVAPPTFILFINDEETLHFSYRRYLINQLRNTFEFTGTPIHIIFREKKGEY